MPPARPLYSLIGRCMRVQSCWTHSGGRRNHEGGTGSRDVTRNRSCVSQLINKTEIMVFYCERFISTVTHFSFECYSSPNRRKRKSAIKLLFVPFVLGVFTAKHETLDPELFRWWSFSSASWWRRSAECKRDLKHSAVSRFAQQLLILHLHRFSSVLHRRRFLFVHYINIEQ